MGTAKAMAISAVALGVAAVALPERATADPAPCDAWESEYVVGANLELKDTPMGQGDGVYTIGPGTAIVRFEPGGKAKLLVYRMREHFEIVSKTLVWTTRVTTDTRTSATPNACAVAAEGTLSGQTLRWTTPVRGYRTDGTLTCDGSLCGKFGAPPSGQSELHIGPSDVTFSPFVFGADLKTFRMPFTFVAKTDMPKQTAYVALAAREVRRTCVTPKTCP